MPDWPWWMWLVAVAAAVVIALDLVTVARAIRSGVVRNPGRSIETVSRQADPRRYWALVAARAIFPLVSLVIAAIFIITHG